MGRTCIAALLALGICAGARGDESADERFLAGLRERQLFELAETYCRDELRGSDLEEDRRADLVIELSRTLAEHALYTVPPQRERLWEEAREVAEQYVNEHQPSLKRLLVEVQSGLVLLARGELLRQEGQIALEAAQAEKFAAARDWLYRAIRTLRDAAEKADDRLRPVGRPRPEAAEERKLRSLVNNVQYQLARAHRNQAQCYPPESADQVDQLTQATSLLSELAKLPDDDPLSWPARLEAVACYRLLKNYETAARRLEAIIDGDPPPRVRLMARAERIHLALAREDLDEALQLARQGRQLENRTAPELDYALLQVFLAGWQRSRDQKDEEAAQRWRQAAREQSELLETLYGAYWGRRGELLLARYISTAPGLNDLALLVQAAQASYRGGQLDEAIRQFDRARRRADELGQTEQVFSLAYSAASIEHGRKAYAEARRRFHELALAHREHPRAPQAHLLAAYNAARLADNGPEALADYRALLEEHLELWPGSPTTDQAHWWLGRLHEYQNELEEAIGAYAAVSPGHAQYDEAVAGLGRCYSRKLAELRAAERETGEVSRAAEQQFRQIISGGEREWPEEWTRAQRAAALALARVWLNYTRDNFQPAQMLLKAALEGSPEPQAAWETTARTLLVVALAGQGKREEAERTLAQIASGEPAELLGMLEGLGRVAEAAPPDVRRELARLQLSAAALLDRHRDELAEAARLRADLIRSRALAELDRVEESLEILAELAEARPRDPSLQEEYGRRLLDAGDEESLATAVDLWRTLAQHTRPGTPRWLRVKYHLALTHERRGDKEQAAEIINVTRVLHPDLGGPALKEKFLELLERCRR